MTTTAEYLALLGPSGQAREFMRKAKGGGDWVDDFCDGLIHRLSLQTELERAGKVRSNTWLIEGHKWQVNTSPQGQEGWTIVIGDDLLADLVSSLKRHR